MSRLTVSLLAAAAVLAAPAQGAERHVTPESVTTTGSCAAEAPCTLAAAVHGASADDVVVVKTGEYLLPAPITANVRLTIRGIPGEQHPQLKGAFSTPTVNLAAGGTLRHLAISSSGLDGEAIQMSGGTLDDAAGVSTGEGGSGLVATTDGGLLVRDSAFRAWGSTAPGAAIAVSGAGAGKLLNVTAYADTGPTGIHCEPAPGGTVKIVNTLVRGATADITAPQNGCTARTSNFRPAHTSGISALGANQSADPVLYSVPAGNFRPMAGSPTIDAGTADPDLGTHDLDGLDRVLGDAPDIGAYEFPAPPKAPGRPADVVTPPKVAQLPEPAQHAPRAEPATPARPALGKSVVLDASAGEVRVKTPGGRFVRLADAENLPVGTVIDARKGTVALQTSIGGGRQQTGEFRGGMFTVRQDARAKGYTDLVLTGGSRSGCRTRTRARAAANGGQARKKKRSGVVRRLWGKDRSGRFRTHGSKSVATVRGTRWLTEDRCTGTFTKVTEGAVDVRSKRTGRVTRVKAGRSVLVN